MTRLLLLVAFLTAAPAFGAVCCGDLDGNGVVSDGELLAGVVCQINPVPVPPSCAPADCDGDGDVTFAEQHIIQDNHDLGCNVPTRTPTPTGGAGPTPTAQRTVCSTTTYTVCVPL